MYGSDRQDRIRGRIWFVSSVTLIVLCACSVLFDSLSWGAVGLFASLLILSTLFLVPS